MDIVERLRGMKVPLDTGPGVMIHPTAAEAATEIERLRKELDAAETLAAEAIHGYNVQHEQLAACQRDAERYRYWRNKYPETFAPTTITPEDVDRLTDAAMEGK